MSLSVLAPRDPAYPAMSVCTASDQPRPDAPPTLLVCLALRDEAEAAGLEALLRRYGQTVQCARPGQTRVDPHGRSDRLLVCDADARPAGVAWMGLADGAGAARVAALDAGAVDCLSRPFEPRELLARIAAWRRRSHWRSTGAGAASSSSIHFGAWELDLLKRCLVGPGGVSTPLTLAEWRLLQTFLSRPRCVLSRDDLLDLARGRHLEAYDRSIDLLVSRLRHKLGDDPAHPAYIHTIRGVGYLFDAFGLDQDVRHVAAPIPHRQTAAPQPADHLPGQAP